MNRTEPIYAYMQEKTSKIEDLSARWYSAAHANGVAQLSAMLALRRGPDPSLAIAMGLLHDIAYVLLGSYERHGELGAQMARVILAELKGFSVEETGIICSAIAKHDSDPRTYTGYDAILSEADFMEPYIRTQELPRTERGREKLAELLAELGIQPAQSEQIGK